MGAIFILESRRQITYNLIYILGCKFVYLNISI